MPARFQGSTSGYLELDAPAVAGSNTLVLPTGNGTNGQRLTTNGSGSLSWTSPPSLTLGTAQNSTSGTTIEFLSLPSTIKRISVIFNGVSFAGAATVPAVQLGTSSGFATTGYVASSGISSTAGFPFAPANFGAAINVIGVLSVCNLSGNTWMANGAILRDPAGTDGTSFASGIVTLSGVLDRIRMLDVSGGSTAFDAGVINILYES